MNTLEQLEDSMAIGNGEVELTLSNGPSLFAGLSVAGNKVADLVVVSSCNANGLPDYCYGIGPPTIRQVGDETVVEITGQSSLWERKTYYFKLRGDWVEYYYVLEGSGRIDDCEFFQGFVGESQGGTVSHPWVHGEPVLGHWGRLRSKPYFGRVFNPEPNGLRKRFFRPTEYSTIGVRSDKSYCRGNWFFTPGPFCFVVEGGAQTWVAFGLAVKPGEHTFTRYDCPGGNGFGLTLRYEGRASVRGRWESPHVLIGGSRDEYAALSRYSERVRETVYSALIPGEQFSWWSEPIFCGWGEQCYLQYSNGGAGAADFASQSNYEAWLDALARQGVFPGIVIVDDKWQRAYGSCQPDNAKWPDMKGFIHRQHLAGRRVLLWFKAWDPEGVPPDECVLSVTGRALSVDPSSPAYETRLRRQVALALGGLGADGFKIDFTAMHPPATAGETFGGIWGVELLKRLLWIIRDEAKKTKRDALIIAHTVNPYLVDVFDVVRLNDVAIVQESDSYLESMVHRQRVARAACPQLLIDTDNWPSPSVDAWLEYVREQPRLGIPSLYYATHVDESSEELDASCFAEIRRSWAEYRENCARRAPGNGAGA